MGNEVAFHLTFQSSFYEGSRTVDTLSKADKDPIISVIEAVSFLTRLFFTGRKLVTEASLTTTIRKMPIAKQQQIVNILFSKVVPCETMKLKTYHTSNS